MNTLRFLACLSLCGLSSSCPSVCSCNGNRTDCSDLGQQVSMDSITEHLSSDTRYLILSQNNFSAMQTGSFMNLSSLLRLDLSRNLLSNLHPLSFSHLNSLEFLDLSDNLLSGLHVNLFADLSSLTELVLRGNGLTELDSDQFTSLMELRRLDLSFNSLSSLPKNLLDGLQNLVWLSLVSNKLRTLERKSLEPASALQNILLERNPWNCSCRLIPLKHWLEWIKYKGGQVDSVRCSFPASLHDQDLLNVPMEMFRHCYPLYIESRNPSVHGGHQDCVRQRYRPISVRRATATVVIAGVVCSVVCVLMVVTATYGCIYATLIAREHQQMTQDNKQQPAVAKEPEVEEKEKLMSNIGKEPETPEWVAFPPEVCV